MVQQLSSMVAMRLRNNQIHEMSRFIRYTQNLENLKTLKHPRQKSLWPPSRNRWGGKNFSRYNQKTVFGALRVPLYIHTYSGTSQARNTLYWFLLDQYFLKKKSETSSEDISVRAVFLDDSLSAPRSRTWRTCFYLSLVISQPEQNIWAWGKKIIKLEVQAEVRLGMNLFLFCLPLAVPSTFRPKEV